MRAKLCAVTQLRKLHANGEMLNSQRNLLLPDAESGKPAQSGISLPRSAASRFCRTAQPG
jgi:hypothetical protein